MKILKHALSTLLLLLTIGSGAAIAQVKPPEGGKIDSTSLEVHTIRLSQSNAHLLKTATPVLIDTGTSKDMPALLEGLKAYGLRPEDIALVVLTHGHSDHAGLAAEFKRLGHAKIALGAGDLAMVRTGNHGTLAPQNVTARLLDRFVIDPRYQPFEPDIVITGELDLSPWGVHGKAVAMPGHTPGSLVVLLDGRRAVVGDIVLGGYLGGALMPHHAGQHYFQGDVARNEDNIARLLKLGVDTFYLGHGGPVSRDSVSVAFPAAAASAASN
ncbi:MAG: MBL fold metallo-hydrolase [Betaproteobacteria bacterium]